MDAKEPASLLDVAGKVTQPLVVEHSADAWRVDIGGANKADGVELREIGVVMERGLVFGVDSGPAESRDGRVDGRRVEDERAVAESSNGANGGGDRVVAIAGCLGVEQDVGLCGYLCSLHYQSDYDCKDGPHDLGASTPWTQDARCCRPRKQSRTKGP